MRPEVVVGRERDDLRATILDDPRRVDRTCGVEGSRAPPSPARLDRACTLFDMRSPPEATGIGLVMGDNLVERFDQYIDHRLELAQLSR